MFTLFAGEVHASQILNSWVNMIYQIQRIAQNLCISCLPSMRIK